MIRIRQIKVPIENDNDAVKIRKIAKKLNINENDILEIVIRKQSLDARDNKHILYSYEVDVKVNNEDIVLNKCNSIDIFKCESDVYVAPKSGNEELKNKLVIVGCGPAGLFAAYILLENGYKPLIIERGKKVEERTLDVENFWKSGILNLESNVQFGEGGAGTFSDGKLNTLVKDKRNLGRKVFEVFVKCGAPEEILYVHNPHIGTDILRRVVTNMRNEIIKMGGEFRYQTQLTNLVINEGKLKKIIVNDKEEILCDNLILAIGHSARDTFKMLYENKLDMKSKPFAIGIRIMHNQSDINKNQYGENFKLLPNASYKLTYKTKNNRGVYSFCMCPGGYVVNASSELKRLAINGMSNYKRDSGISNSAIVVTVSNEDYGNNLMDGIEFQRKLESNVWKVTEGKIPLQLWGDFKNNKKSIKFGSINPMIKGNYEFSNLRDVLPEFITESLLEAMPEFGKKIKGFDNDDVILAAIESRTSSPVRIIRDENYESNIKGIYPSGEGAGYAGGITTSAIDGILVAESIIKKYKRPDDL